MNTLDAPSTFCYGANVHANNIRQHYLRYGGSGPALVLVPGITSPAPTWGFVGERLGGHFDTYVLDVRGRGLSEASDALDYGVDACAQDVRAFIEALGLRDVVLLGHSMGARIALRAAAGGGMPLARLLLVDPPVSGPGRRAYPSNIAWYRDSIALMQKGGDAEQMRPFCPSWTQEQLQLRAEWLHTCDLRAVLESYEWFHTDDMFPDLPQVQSVPTLVMAAARGEVILDEDLDQMRTLNPGLAMTRVEEAGHMIPWDNEEGFYRACSQFLGVTI